MVTTAYEAPNASWQIHTMDIEGVASDVALTETNGFTVLVLLASDPADHDAYLDSILLPILEVLAVR